MAINATVADPAADSYFTLVEFQAYCAGIDYSLTGKTEAAQEVAARKAANYLDRTYQDRWVGYRATEDQALAWPRRSYPADAVFYSSVFTSVTYAGIKDADGFEIDHETVPARVKKAAYEAAILVLDGVDLLPVLPRGGRVAAKSVTAGPVETSTEYSAGAPVEDQRLTIEGLLRGLITGGPGSGSQGRIVRG